MTNPSIIRLQREALRTSEIQRVSAFCFLLTAGATAYQIGIEHQRYAGTGWLPVISSIVGAAFTWWRSIRLRRRADWYEITPEWWLHLEEAPEVRPLPTSMYKWMDRIENR